MAQVKNSPDVNTERPVSRQMESTVYDYYGWRPYWGSGFYMGGYGFAGAPWPTLGPLGSRHRDEEIASNQRNNDDPHLRSIEAVIGYHINARDGEIGHVENMLVEDTDWSIHYLVVDTKNWWPAKKVLTSPASTHDINWSDRLVNLDVDRQKIKSSPEYDESMAVDQNYEMRFRNYYGGAQGFDQP